MAPVATAQPTSVREMIEDPGWQPPAETRRWERRLCGICPSCCAVRVEKIDGRIGRVVPDKDSPMGYICKLGVHSADIVHSTDRLRYPMKRVGKKGGYDFDRIGFSCHKLFRVIASTAFDEANVGEDDFEPAAGDTDAAGKAAQSIRVGVDRGYPAAGCGDEDSDPAQEGGVRGSGSAR